MSWFSDHAVLFALICAGAAVVYGLGLTSWLLDQPAGTERMQEISRAVQEGAAAYLRRQYTDDRDRRDRPVPAARLLQQARLGNGHRLPDRRRALVGRRLHRDERRRALERPHRGGRAHGAPAGAERRVPRGLGHRPPRRRPRPARRRGLLLGAHRLARPHAALGDQGSARPRLRRLAHLRLRASRRRHLHEGRRRRRRPRRQARGGHPRGRPAQPGRDRRQRRRQRRRLRRHGGRPLRDVRRHRGRGDAARHHRRRGDHRHASLALPARDRRPLDPHVDHRLAVRARARGRQRDERALPQRARRDGAERARVHPDHDGVRHERPVQLLAPVRRRARRARRHVPARRHHRVLHRHALEPGEGDREGVGDRPRDEHHRGPRDRHAGDRAAR